MGMLDTRFEEAIKGVAMIDLAPVRHVDIGCNICGFMNWNRMQQVARPSSFELRALRTAKRDDFFCPTTNIYFIVAFRNLQGLTKSAARFRSASSTHAIDQNQADMLEVTNVNKYVSISSSLGLCSLDLNVHTYDNRRANGYTRGRANDSPAVNRWGTRSNRENATFHEYQSFT